jgi:hypothetical protein
VPVPKFKAAKAGEQLHIPDSKREKQHQSNQEAGTRYRAAPAPEVHVESLAALGGGRLLSQIAADSIRSETKSAISFGEVGALV